MDFNTHDIFILQVQDLVIKIDDEDKEHRRCSRLDQFKDRLKRSQVLIKGKYEGIFHTCDKNNV